MLLSVLKSVGLTTRNRLQRGPLLPSWSWGFEALVCALRLDSQVAAQSSPSTWAPRRERDARRFRSRLSKFFTRTPETLGCVDGEWFTPKGQDPTPVILYLHGGAFIVGSSRTHADIIMRLTLAAHAKTFAPNYRHAPAHTFPCQIEEVLSAYKGLLARDYDPTQIVLAGDSAGANLCLQILLAAHAQQLPMPAGALLWSPWVDLTAQGGSLAQNAPFEWFSPADIAQWTQLYLTPPINPSDPRVSPVFADFQGMNLPPIRVEIGTAELMLDQARALSQALRAAGAPVEHVELPDMIHDAYILAPFFKHCQDLIEDSAQFIHRLTSASDRL